MADTLPIKRWRDLAALQNWFDLRREDQAVVLCRVIKGLDAETVPAEQQLTASRIPDREREHAAQMIDERRAMIFVEVNETFGVGGSTEHVAALRQVMAQLPVVIDLAVEDDPDRAIFIRDRLPARVEA